MTRVLVLSDLHLEINSQFSTDSTVGVDVVVLAGDTHTGVRGVLWAAERFPRQHVLYVPGNHEYYNGVYDVTRENLAMTAADSDNVTLLDGHTVEIDGVFYIGATLWTDYRLNGNPEVAKVTAQTALNDHVLIGKRTAAGIRRFEPDDAAFEFEKQQRYIREMLVRARDTNKRAVVITHHVPHPRSIAAKHAGDPINPAFASDLSELINSAEPMAWIHGHTHCQFDYRVGPTRVICNPRGYVRARGSDNPEFNPNLVIEIGA